VDRIREGIGLGRDHDLDPNDIFVRRDVSIAFRLSFESLRACTTAPLLQTLRGATQG